MNSESYLVVKELLGNIKIKYNELFSVVSEIHDIQKQKNQERIDKDIEEVEALLKRADILYQLIQESSAEVSALLSQITLS